MNALTRLAVGGIILLVIGGCNGRGAQPDGGSLLARSSQAWYGEWHAVWQFEWKGAPVRGPLVAEIWHTADGRLRIETLEASAPALSGLTLVDNGQTARLYDVRYDRMETGPSQQVRIPLACDGLDAISWLLSSLDIAEIAVSSQEVLESGLATRLLIRGDGGDRAVLWVDDQTGLPSRVEVTSAVWGEATFAARSVSAGQPLPPGLFDAPGQGP